MDGKSPAQKKDHGNITNYILFTLKSSAGGFTDALEWLCKVSDGRKSLNPLQDLLHMYEAEANGAVNRTLSSVFVICTGLVS